MTSAPVAFAADHAGFDLKQALIRGFEAEGGQALDLGTHSAESVDYPDMAEALARCIAEGHTARGVIVCGTGIGIAIAANRHRHIRAAVCHDVTSARLTRLHNVARGGHGRRKRPTAARPRETRKARQGRSFFVRPRGVYFLARTLRVCPGLRPRPIFLANTERCSA